MAYGKNRFFHWNKRERRGSLALLFMLAAMLFVYGYLKQTPDSSWMPDNEFIKFARQFADSQTTVSQKQNNPDVTYADKSGSRNKFQPISGSFNPNGLSESEWMNMGLSAPQARTLKKYEAAGGRFYKKEDLKKVFVISEAFYAHIEPFVVIPSGPEGKEKT
jgi:hypothetical protein